MSISIAPLLKQQSQSRHFGHGWIELRNGKRWHPAHSQKELLAQMATKPGESLSRKVVKWLAQKLRALCP